MASDSVIPWLLAAASAALPSVASWLASRPKQITVSRLFIYPIKSCAGFEVSSAEFDRLGFHYDRRWMLVRRATNRFFSQRDHSRMAVIRTSLRDGALVVSAPDHPDLAIPLTANPAAESLTVSVWDDSIEALTVSDECDAWFSKVLQTDLRLVRTLADTAAHSRPIDPNRTTPFATANRIEAPFADGFPFLLCSEESVEELNRRLPANEQVDVRNFRPNIVVKGCAPFQEDFWRAVRIGDNVFDIIDACSRCSVPTINQDTGLRSATYQPTIALREFHARGKAVYFGQNVIQRATHGTVRAGAPVVIEASQDHSNLEDLPITV